MIPIDRGPKIKDAFGVALLTAAITAVFSVIWNAMPFTGVIDWQFVLTTTAVNFSVVLLAAFIANMVYWDLGASNFTTNSQEDETHG